MTWVGSSLGLRWNSPGNSWWQETAAEVPEGWGRDHMLQGLEGRVRRGFMERALPSWALLESSNLGR